MSLPCRCNVIFTPLEGRASTFEIGVHAALRPLMMIAHRRHPGVLIMPSKLSFLPCCSSIGHTLSRFSSLLRTICAMSGPYQWPGSVSSWVTVGAKLPVQPLAMACSTIMKPESRINTALTDLKTLLGTADAKFAMQKPI